MKLYDEALHDFHCSPNCMMRHFMTGAHHETLFRWLHPGRYGE